MNMIEDLETVRCYQMTCGICGWKYLMDCGPYQFIEEGLLAKIKYYLQQYRKNLYKAGMIPDYGDVARVNAKRNALSVQARRWMKKAVKSGYDHATMLPFYWRALN